MTNILIALKIMGLGMLGIFAALLIIMLVVYALQAADKFSSSKKEGSAAEGK